MRLLNSLGPSEIAAYLYPNIYDCTSMDESIGQRCESGVKLFPILRASVIRLEPGGVYIAGIYDEFNRPENGRHLFIYLGSEVSPQLLQGIFGVDRLGTIPMTNDLPILEHAHSVQIRFLISYIRAQRPRFLHLSICRQGLDPLNEARFSNLLIEDANFDNSSYVDYIVQLHRFVFLC